MPNYHIQIQKEKPHINWWIKCGISLVLVERILISLEAKKIIFQREPHSDEHKVYGG